MSALEHAMESVGKLPHALCSLRSIVSRPKLSAVHKVCHVKYSTVALDGGRSIVLQHKMVFCLHLLKAEWCPLNTFLILRYINFGWLL